MYIYTISSLLCWWTFRSLLCFRCCKLFYGYMPRKGTAASYGISFSSFLRTLHSVSTVAVLTDIPSSSAGGSAPPHAFYSIYCLWFFFLMIAILAGVRWFIVFLICIYLIISDVEYPFMFLLAIYMSSLEKGWLFLNWIFCYFL